MKRLVITLFAAAALAGGAVLSTVAGQNVAYAQQTDAEAKRVVEAAKDRGEVGEQFDGRLGAVEPLSPEVKAAMDHINLSRKALYLELASQSGDSELDVGKTAAIRQFRDAKPGHFLKWEDGTWRQK